jgi:hypothetical protein
MNDFVGTIAIWGDDSSTSELDGAESLSIVTLYLVNSNILYEVITEEIVFSVNDVYLFESLDFSIVDCGNDQGCTDSAAMNFN